jgi:hypothetical protein
LGLLTDTPSSDEKEGKKESRRGTNASDNYTVQEEY